MDEPLTLAQQALVAEHIALPHWFARRQTATCPELLEHATDACRDGLIRAARIFDPARDRKFSTLACACMRTAFWSMLRHMACMKVLPSEPVVSLDLIRSAEPEWESRLPDGTPDFEGLISPLSPREREILTMRFRDELTLEEVGLRLGITKEWVRQLQDRALAQLRRILDQAA